MYLATKSQKTNDKKKFYSFFAILSAALFVITGIRSATVPFAHDEVATFFYYIQPGSFLPYFAHVDTNNHILNSCLSWICFKLFGDSTFSLRLPNLLALLVLIFAIYRISKQLTYTHSKIVLVTGFLVSFNWLSFYSMCRGYGLSMSFLILSISYLIDYFNSKQPKKVFLFYLFIQIAISDNLILLFIALALTFSIIVFQLFTKEFLKKTNILVCLIHNGFLLFWIKFSFFLQTHFLHPYEHIFTPSSQGYWKITFVSLIELLTGTTNKWIPFLTLLCFLILVLVVFIINFEKVRTNILAAYTPSLFYILVLSALILTFYALNKFFNVSFPEDRMGFFFYVCFIIALVFSLDQFQNAFAKIFTYIVFTGALVQFALNINFHKHAFSFYQTIPRRFYTRLLEEQKLNPERITISGQTWGEFIYDFWNYRYNGKLNILNVAENKEIAMNCDYAIASEQQEKYYLPYYDEIDKDKDWNISLLKRKEKIKRNLVLSSDTLKSIKGNNEFYNLYLAKNLYFKNTNPLLIEININSIEGKMPINSWIVFNIDSAEGHSLSYKRIPLNWLRYDWSNSKNQQLDLVSTPISSNVHSLICYVWNIDKKEISLKINSIKIYQLEDNGINVSIHPSTLVSP